MRLIDADKLLEDLEECYDDCDIQDMLDFFGIYECIKKQPTAYDVDKVVKELDELLTINMEVLGVRADYVNLAHVIEKVKRGGLDEN
jgi:uncharacterized protein YqgQ